MMGRRGCSPDDHDDKIFIYYRPASSAAILHPRNLVVADVFPLGNVSRLCAWARKTPDLPTFPTGRRGSDARTFAAKF